MHEGLFSGSVRPGLRTRFNPKSRIGQGLISVAPWASVMLILIAFSLLDPHVVLQPGVTVDLPRMRAAEGVAPELVAVVLSVERGAGARQEIVFFDDERYLLGNRGQARRLKERMAARLREHPSRTLVLQADRRVSHGTMLTVMRMALESGAARVALAVELE